MLEVKINNTDVLLYLFKSFSLIFNLKKILLLCLILNSGYLFSEQEEPSSSTQKPKATITITPTVTYTDPDDGKVKSQTSSESFTITPTPGSIHTFSSTQTFKVKRPLTEEEKFFRDLNDLTDAIFGIFDFSGKKKKEDKKNQEKQPSSNTDILSENNHATEEENQEKLSPNTEAGAACIDGVSCSSKESSSIQSLQSTVNNALCASMQNKPECKGIDKEDLKGCLPEGTDSFMDKAIRAISSCGTGLHEGVKNSFSSIGDVLKSVFKWVADSSVGDEDPGVVSYLHAEFESVSQDSGMATASFESILSLLHVIFEANKEVYSCLNDVGVTKKVCQFTSNAPVNFIAGSVAGTFGPIVTSLAMPMYLIARVLYQTLPNDMKEADIKKKSLFMAVMPQTAFIGLGAIGMAARSGNVSWIFAPQKQMSSLLLKISGYIGGVLAVAPGSFMTHDQEVYDRVKEKMKKRILELKEQQEKSTLP